jgi:hypothetical protein
MRNIEFPETDIVNEVNNFGNIIFRVLVDGVIASCLITSEALQDINPAEAQGEPEAQYKNNMSRFQEIARRKINNGEIIDGRVIIGSGDL